MPDERQPLLQNAQNGAHKAQRFARRHWVAGGVVLLFVAATIVFSVIPHNLRGLPNDPFEAALEVLSRHPVIDTHIDLPFLLRLKFRNNATAVDLESEMPGQVDLPRLREGRVGGFFWSVYTDCPKHTGKHFENPTNSARDTLEQIDIAKAIIDKYPKDFKLSLTTDDIARSKAEGRIASLLGIEGAHQLGNSLAALRQFHALGVRYVTLTHSCHNVFADSAGIFEALPPLHHGLSPFGGLLIKEMNRLGVLVDLSHTSDETTLQALHLSEAPVIWSHSSARAKWNVPRNVPDNILRRIGHGYGQKDGVVQVNFAPYFIAGEGNATVFAVADHVEHIGKIAGREHVGLGSDFDGIGTAPVGLEDVSMYPNLFAELVRRGWKEKELAGLAGDNLIRVFKGAERVAKQLQKELRSVAYELYDRRTDL